MKNKFLVEIKVPDIDHSFHLFIPINKKVGNIINLINKSISDMTNGEYQGSEKTKLYSRDTNLHYDVNKLIRETDIKQGSIMILM